MTRYEVELATSDRIKQRMEHLTGSLFLFNFQIPKVVKPSASNFIPLKLILNYLFRSPPQNRSKLPSLPRETMKIDPKTRSIYATLHYTKFGILVLGQGTDFGIHISA